jgi:hypothetical protein
MKKHVEKFLKLIEEVFNWNTMYLANEETVNLFVWMSKQRYSIIASVHQMGLIYNVVQQHVNKSCLQEIITNNEPFLWFPIDDQRIMDGYVAGELYPLSQVVEDDKTGFLQRMLETSIILEANSPSRLSNAIRVVKSVYSEYNFQAVSPFIRSTVCYACQVLEGMHGRRGIAKCHANDPVFMNQSCKCSESHCTVVFRSLPGLIRKSPSVDDLLSVVGNYCSQYIQILLLKSENVIYSKHLEELITQIKIIFEAIRKEVCKCFHTTNSLHPYSSSSLRRLIELLRVNSYFPLTPHQSNDDSQKNFICVHTAAKNIRYLSVDDKLLFDHFKGILIASSINAASKRDTSTDNIDINNDNTHSLVKSLLHPSPNSFDPFKEHQSNECAKWYFIDAIPTEKTVNNSFFLDLENNISIHEDMASNYDLAIYEESRKVFLSKSREEFHHYCIKYLE